ncbi:MAG: hypothetical protein KDJ35_01650 [Alphaproteobacteria bacterium]|nr:hypothetical protein [Alphaproteobacteria bacterium]
MGATQDNTELNLSQDVFPVASNEPYLKEPEKKLFPPSLNKELSEVNTAYLKALHYNAEYEALKVNGKDVYCHFMPAKNAKGVVIIRHGYNSTFSGYINRRGHPEAPHFFEILNQNGLSAISLSSEHIDPMCSDFIEQYKAEVQTLLFDKNSPVFDMTGNIPVHLLSHSLGGYATLNALSQRDNLEFANEHYSSVHVMNPALAIANVTRNPLVKAFYREWSNQFPDNIPGTTWMGKTYMWARGIPIEWDNPPHKHIQAMDSAGTACIKKLEQMVQSGEFNRLFDLSFIVGLDDPTTCPVTNIKLANTMGANKFLSAAQHTPVLPPKGAQYEKAHHVPMLPAASALIYNVLKNSQLSKPVIQMAPEQKPALVATIVA